MLVVKKGEKVLTKDDFNIDLFLSYKYRCRSCQSIIKLQKEDFERQRQKGLKGLFGATNPPRVTVEYQLRLGQVLADQGAWMKFDCPHCGYRVLVRFSRDKAVSLKPLPDFDEVAE